MDTLSGVVYVMYILLLVTLGDKTTLLSSSDPINGRKPRFFNDLDIGPDGTIYISDTSTKWGRRDNRLCIMEGESTGR